MDKLLATVQLTMKANNYTSGRAIRTSEADTPALARQSAIPSNVLRFPFSSHRSKTWIQSRGLNQLYLNFSRMDVADIL